MNGYPLRLILLAVCLFVQGTILSLAASRAEENGTSDDLASFRNQVVETLKQSWQVVDARVVDRNEAAVDLYLRRAHYPIRQQVDIRTLHRDLLGQDPDRQAVGILKFFDKEVFRPLSQSLVKSARPIIVGELVVERWRVTNQKLSGPSFPATVPLSNDAFIAFEHGFGTGTIRLTNYDFDGIPIEKRLDAVKVLLDECSAKVNIQKMPNGLDALPTLEDFLSGERCGDPVLSTKFWESVADRYPEGAYVAFPFEQSSVPNTVLIDKRLPNARETLRSNMKLKFTAPSNHIYEFKDGKLVLVE